MLKAYKMFSCRINNMELSRNLEIVWDGIGSWRGKNYIIWLCRKPLQIMKFVMVYRIC